MLPTPVGRVWQMQLGFIKTSLGISDKRYICLLEQIQTLQEIQSDILTNPQCIYQICFRVWSIHMHFKKMSVFDGVNENKCLKIL